MSQVDGFLRRNHTNRLISRTAYRVHFFGDLPISLLHIERDDERLSLALCGNCHLGRVASGMAGSSSQF